MALDERNGTAEPNGAHTSPDEQSPLLGRKPTGTENGTAATNGETENSPEEEEEDDTPIAEEISTTKLVIIMGSIWFGCFFSALDGTIIATLSTPISSSFNSLSLLSWIASAYLIANSAFQPLCGRLTDILGRRTGLVFSGIFFGAGNLICGLAKESWVMILGRVVAGIGGGGLPAISTFVGSDLIPLRRRGVWQGIGNIFYGVGMGLGGVFGGWMNDTIGWRWAFLIQVPFVAFTTALYAFTVKIPIKKTNKPTWRRIDYLGATLMVTGLVLLLLGINSGGNQVPWTHPLVLTCLPLSAVFLCLFVYVEDKVVSEPVIPVRLLLDRTVACACLVNWFGTMATFGALYFLPIYFQVRGSSTTGAGARLIPQSVGTAIGSLGSGLIMRKTGRYYALFMVGQAVFLLSLILCGTYTLDSPAWQTFLYPGLCGFGYGSLLTITLLALIAAVDHKNQAVVTSASYAFRSTGSTIGITVASAVFQNVLKTQLIERFADRKDAAEIIGRVRDSFDEIKNLPPGWHDGVLDSYMAALRSMFYVLIGFGALTLIFGAFIREHKLHTNLSRK